MKLSAISKFLLSGCLLLSIGCAGHRKDHDQSRAMAKREAVKMTPEQMQAAMVKSATPTEYHRALDTLVGNWSVSSKMWMEPGQKPYESTGSATFRWILDGRYIEQQYMGSVHGQTFKGIGLIAYNNLGKRYQSTWIDSMGTQVMLSEGTIDAAKQKITFVGSFDCPMTNSEHTATTTLTVDNPNRHVFEMYDEGVDGSLVKTMEIVYTRIGNAPVSAR